MKKGDVRDGDHLKESGEMVGKDPPSERVKIPSYNNIFKKEKLSIVKNRIQM